METEKQLLDAIRNGEKAALRRLYERYANYAMAIGLRYIPERDEVRDVLQDSFVKILTTIERFDYRGQGSLKAWVARIVSNTAITHLREQGRFNKMDAIPDMADETDEEPDVGQLPPQVLTELIGQLPVNYRTVLNLYVFEQCPHREIAQRLGIKENTSSSIFFRAKKMLAKMIADYNNRTANETRQR